MLENTLTQFVIILSEYEQRFTSESESFFYILHKAAFLYIPASKMLIRIPSIMILN